MKPTKSDRAVQPRARPPREYIISYELLIVNIVVVLREKRGLASVCNQPNHVETKTDLTTKNHHYCSTSTNNKGRKKRKGVFSVSPPRAVPRINHERSPVNVAKNK